RRLHQPRLDRAVPGHLRPGDRHPRRAGGPRAACATQRLKALYPRTPGCCTSTPSPDAQRRTLRIRNFSRPRRATARQRAYPNRNDWRESKMILQTNKLRDAIALALVAGAAGLAGTGTAFAQDQDQEGAASDTTTLDRIEVTGSRLKRAEIEGALPVTVLDRETIDASGQVSVADYLRTVSFNTAGQFRPRSGSSAQAGAFADLRGLGSQRTLVLVDGHRQPSAPFAAGAGADLNSIPLAAVERIEVLTDGASAIYGADAVGGVINIITRKDYNGAQVTVGHSS